MDEQMDAITEFDAVIPEIWSSSWYPNLFEKMVFAESVGHAYEQDIQALGDKVNITTFPQFPEARDLAEGQKNDAQKISLGSTQLVVNKQTVQDFIVTKRAERQSLPVQQKIMELAFFSIIKKMQKNIMAEIAPSAAAPDHVLPYSSGVTMALADWIEVKGLLDAQNVNENGRIAILGTNQINSLFNISGFMSRDFVPNSEAMSSGAINSPVLGFLVKWTTSVEDTSTFFSPEFLQMAVQENPVPELFNLGGTGDRAKRVNMTVLYGIKQVDGLRVVQKA
jgi:hypothetical protein